MSLAYTNWANSESKLALLFEGALDGMSKTDLLENQLARVNVTPVQASTSQSNICWTLSSPWTMEDFVIDALGHSMLSATSIQSLQTGIKNMWGEVYNLEKSSQPRLAAQKIMLFVESHLNENNVVHLNKFLLAANMSELSVRSLIGLVRSTFRVAAKLPAWKSVYSQARVRVVELGRDPNSVFIGLPTI